ncbi:uncharacterized protein LOC143026618 [Oratosquilla oratoria]|uniref:uncharacterized protein LOC143026618 n=1 Tax=Oratosquilla oratoria TaxID=337810 RepID=UPI003F75D857
MGGETTAQNSLWSQMPHDPRKSKEETLQLVNQEIMSLYDYLQREGVSGSDWEDVTKPLVRMVRMAKFKKWVRRVMALAALFLAFYMALQIPWVHKAACAIGRQSLMLVLPKWDWTKIYYSDCFLSNPYYVSQSLMEDDCNVCESMERLDHLVNVSAVVVSEEYLKNDVPFVVVDGMDNWEVMNTDQFWFDNVTELYLTDDMRGIYPCELTTNLRVRSDDLIAFLRKIHNPDVHRWYGHWENCNKKAAKLLRQMYRRPYFIPHMVDLSDSNWVLISSNYKGKVYKEIVFQTEMLLVVQIRGWTRFRLVPREPCDHYCPELFDSIREGEMVVVTSLMWKFEYIPGENTDNLAIAVGGFWN